MTRIWGEVKKKSPFSAKKERVSDQITLHPSFFTLRNESWHLAPSNFFCQPPTSNPDFLDQVIFTAQDSYQATFHNIIAFDYIMRMIKLHQIKVQKLNFITHIIYFVFLLLQNLFMLRLLLFLNVLRKK